MSRSVIAAMLLAAPVALFAQPESIPIANASFEEGEDAWSLPDGSMGEVTDEQAASGDYSLKIVDTDGDKGGSNVLGPRVPIDGKGSYELRFKTFPVTGSGCGIYVRVLDADGNAAVPGDQYQRGAPSSPANEWVDASLRIFAPADARFLQVWVALPPKASPGSVLVSGCTWAN